MGRVRDLGILCGYLKNAADCELLADMLMSLQSQPTCRLDALGDGIWGTH